MLFVCGHVTSQLIILIICHSGCGGGRWNKSFKTHFKSSQLCQNISCCKQEWWEIQTSYSYGEMWYVFNKSYFTILPVVETPVLCEPQTMYNECFLGSFLMINDSLLQLSATVLPILSGDLAEKMSI